MKSFKEYLLEKKDHIIRRLKNLTDDEKQQVIDFFARKPNLENQINWQNRDLTFDDFQQVMDVTKTERKRQVKKLGLGGLKSGKDYLEIEVPENFPGRGFIPLHWEASKLLASAKIGGVEGEWCTAYQKDKSYWGRYIHEDYEILIYFIMDDNRTKYAFLLDGKTHKLVEMRDKADKALYGFTNSIFLDFNSYTDTIKANSEVLKKARKLLDKDEKDYWLAAGQG